MSSVEQSAEQVFTSGASIYKALGVRPIINGRGTTTIVSGTLMVPGVIEAMAAAAEEFVVLDELNRAIGKRISQITGGEASYITAGSASGMALSAAACITIRNPDLVKLLPDTEGYPNEFIVQKNHRISYDGMYRLAGGRLIEIGSQEKAADPADLEAAITPNTVAVLYHETAYVQGPAMDFKTSKDIAHAHGLPIIVDAASTLPPVDNLRCWIRDGADLVIYSGGKGIRGPQNSGFITGRADLIEMARRNGNPNAAFGRGMKVAKETMVGLWAALEDFMVRDHETEYRERMDQIQYLKASLDKLPHIHCEIHTKKWPAPIIRIFPQDNAWFPDQLCEDLMAGDPSIHTGVEQGGLIVKSHCLRAGEGKIIAEHMLTLLNGYMSL